MAEVKKSWFLALDPEGAGLTSGDAATAAEIAAATAGFNVAAPSTGADNRTAFLLEPSGLPDLTLDYEEITRDVIRDSYLPAAPLRGIINSTGSMSYELHGGGTNSDSLLLPDQHVLHKSAFGRNIYVGAQVTAGAPTGFTGSAAVGTTITGIDLSAVTGVTYQVGDIVVLKETVSGNHYIVQLTDVSTISSCSAALVWEQGAPDGVPTYVVAAHSAYFMPSSLTKIPNFAIAYYRGNIVRELYAKCAVTSAEFPFSAGELVIPSHSFSIGDGKVDSATYYDGTTYDGIYSAGSTTLSSSVASPLFAKAMDWMLEYADTSVTSPTWNSLTRIVDSFTLTLNNEPSEKRDITAPEGIAEYGVQSRSVELSMTCFYDDSSAEWSSNLTNLFTSSDKYRLRIRAAAGNRDSNGNIIYGDGNTVFMFAPRLSFKPTVSEDSGLFKYDVSGTAEKDPTFGENALTLIYF